MGSVQLNPPTQYATDVNLRSRQRLWEEQRPRFDLVSWVLDAAGVQPGIAARVLDVGCGNGTYLTEMRARGIDAIGCDLSRGMLAAASPHRHLVNADAMALPFTSAAFDVVLAPHMLYHVSDRQTAASELRRVLRRGGRCVVVTNGKDHLRSLRSLVEAAVRPSSTGWEMRDPATHAFSLENGAEQLREAFGHVTVSRPAEVAPAVLTDASIAASYVASIGDQYQAQVPRPWHEIVEEVRSSVQREIDEAGAFTVRSDSGAFICE
jgi:SAM-dependent methyltransferase